MRDVYRVLATALFVLALPAQAADQDLPPGFAGQMRSLGVPREATSVLVVALESGDTLWSLNPDVPRNPASMMKLVTSFAALDQLGPGYRWPTEAYASRAPDSDGAIEDLFVKGYGNPFWVTEDFAAFALELEQRGTREIKGDIILDTSYYDLPPEDSDEFDGKGYRVYNVQPHPLTMNFNSVRFLLVPQPATGELRIETQPELANLVIDNRVKLEHKACRTGNISLKMHVASALEGLTRVGLSGRFPSRCSRYSLTRAVLSHEEQFVGALVARWRQRGGTISGNWRHGVLPEKKRLLYRQMSRPLGDLLRSTNKFSNNVMAKQIFLTLGAEAFGAPASPDKSRLAVNQALANHGLEFAELDIDNGAGLSRSAQISPRNLLRLLQTAWSHRFGSDFFSSLPVPGVDGTLESRFPRGDYVGQAYIKTGTLDHVTGMAGLVQALGGQRYLVVLMINHHNVHKGAGRALQKKLLRTLVTDG